MSSRTKGATFEKEICDYLQGLGFTTDRARPTIRYAGPGKIFSGPNDFFGVADIVGINKAVQYTLFVQCTTDHAKVSQKKADLESVAWNLVAQRPIIWTKDPSRGVWRAYRLLHPGGPVPQDETKWEEHIWRKINAPPYGLL